MLYQVGKPVFLRESPHEYGALMMDAADTSGKDETYWSTVEVQNKLLMEYKDKKHFRALNVTRQYRLKKAFKGNGHVVYNKAFYYHQAGSSNITRRELRNNKTVTWKVEDMKGMSMADHVIQ